MEGSNAALPYLLKKESSPSETKQKKKKGRPKSHLEGSWAIKEKKIKEGSGRIVQDIPLIKGEKKNIPTEGSQDHEVLICAKLRKNWGTKREVKTKGHCYPNLKAFGLGGVIPKRERDSS